MKRSRSPVSEGTIRNIIEEDYLSDSFVSDISNLGHSSDSSSDVDDTDVDPDFDPNEAGTSSGNRGLGLTHNFSRYISDSDSDGSDNDDPIRNRQHMQSRPRLPAHPIGLNESEMPPNEEINTSSESEDEMGWIEVTEANDHLHRPDQIFSFHELPGPKHCPEKDSPPCSYFKLFFTDSLIDIIVQYTNKYAREFIEANRDKLKRHSRAQVWRSVTPSEIYAFIIVLINMGIKNMPSIESYWWTSQSQIIPWFSRMFTRNRFQAILQFFHLVDTRNLPKPNENGYDPCTRFKPLVDHMNRVSKLHFTPGQNISVDESMIATKSHSQLLQYMPKKHHRWGVKLWMLCEAASHYCVSLFVYQRAEGEYKSLITRRGLGFSVVDTLMKKANLYEKGYHIYIDNFFSSTKLAKYLYKKGTYVTGTLRHNRKGIPEQMKTKFSVGETKYMRRNPLILLGYREKKSQKSRYYYYQPVAKLSP
ncbi:zinc finger protein [Homalodisca vitripennis]|nr:zinc finger protein [Homalodisca vitripennis]